MPTAGEPCEFSAAIYRLGINRCVDVPVRISRLLGVGSYIAVRARIGDIEVRTTLVPRGEGKHRLFLNSELRQRAGADTGDVVRITLGRDAGSRNIPVPIDLELALRKRARASEAFEGLTAAQRWEFLRWINRAKKEETRRRRIQKGIEILVKRAASKRKPE